MIPRFSGIAIALTVLAIILNGCTAPLQVITPQAREEPTATPIIPKPTRPPRATPEATPTLLRHIDIAAHLTDINNLQLLKDMGASLFIYSARWADIEKENVTPEGGPPYSWDTVLPMFRASTRENIGVVLRVDSPPDWAWRDADPPLDLAAFADFMGDVAHDYGNKIAAYIIWNEPNLPSSWGGRTPNPAWYAQMLQAVYPRIKQWDSDAIVVASGLATTGGGGCAGDEAPTIAPLSSGAINDLAFLRGLYGSGAQGFFDVLGTHPYGFAYRPGIDPCLVNGQAFRRTEQQRAIMEEFGDGAKPMWAVEFGWVIQPPQECTSDPSWQDLLWQAVDERAQAQYFDRAYRYAAQNWPWLTLLGVFNFDFAASLVYPYCHAFRWWSLAYRNNPTDPSEPIFLRPGYSTLQNIPRQ